MISKFFRGYNSGQPQRRGDPLPHPSPTGRARGCKRPRVRGPRHQFPLGSPALQLFLFYYTTTTGKIVKYASNILHDWQYILSMHVRFTLTAANKKDEKILINLLAYLLLEQISNEIKGTYFHWPVKSVSKILVRIGNHTCYKKNKGTKLQTRVFITKYSHCLKCWNGRTEVNSSGQCKCWQFLVCILLPLALWACQATAVWGCKVPKSQATLSFLYSFLAPSYMTPGGRWRRSSEVRTSAFGLWAFPTLCLIYGWQETTLCVNCPLWVNQPGQLSLTYLPSR